MLKSLFQLPICKKNLFSFYSLSSLMLPMKYLWVSHWPFLQVHCNEFVGTVTLQINKIIHRCQQTSGGPYWCQCFPDQAESLNHLHTKYDILYLNVAKDSFSLPALQSNRELRKDMQRTWEHNRNKKAEYINGTRSKSNSWCWLLRSCQQLKKVAVYEFVKEKKKKKKVVYSTSCFGPCLMVAWQ